MTIGRPQSVASWLGWAGLFVALTVTGCDCGGGENGDDDDDTSLPDSSMDGSLPDGAPLPDGGIPDVGPNADAYFEMDPERLVCEPGMAPRPDNDGTPVGNDPACPDDKNREGCRCDMQNETFACWPGLRANRGRGSCRDGTTTCVPYDEFSGRYGPCTGYVLPNPDGETAADRCGCFSRGQWALTNLNPCIVSDSSGRLAAVNTILKRCDAFDPPIDCGGDPAKLLADCPVIDAFPPTPPPPTQEWTPGTLRVDCEGEFQLCYKIRAFSSTEAAAEQAYDAESDCTITEVCTARAYYGERNVVQEWPPLLSWSATDPASGAGVECIKRFRDIGGYGEMSVRGRSYECDEIAGGLEGDYDIFNRIIYCPSVCTESPPPADLPEICSSCGMGGSGDF